MSGIAEILSGTVAQYPRFVLEFEKRPAKFNSTCTVKAIHNNSRISSIPLLIETNVANMLQSSVSKGKETFTLFVG